MKCLTPAWSSEETIIQKKFGQMYFGFWNPTCVHSWTPGLSDKYVHPYNRFRGFQQAFLIHAKGENNIICEN